MNVSDFTPEVGSTPASFFILVFFSFQYYPVFTLFVMAFAGACVTCICMVSYRISVCFWRIIWKKNTSAANGLLFICIKTERIWKNKSDRFCTSFCLFKVYLKRRKKNEWDSILSLCLFYSLCNFYLEKISIFSVFFHKNFS